MILKLRSNNNILGNEELLNKSYLISDYYKADINRCIAGVLFSSFEES